MRSGRTVSADEIPVLVRRCHTRGTLDKDKLWKIILKYFDVQRTPEATTLCPCRCSSVSSWDLQQIIRITGVAEKDVKVKTGNTVVRCTAIVTGRLTDEVMLHEQEGRSLQEWRSTLEVRSMKVSRPKTRYLHGGE